MEVKSTVGLSDRFQLNFTWATIKVFNLRTIYVADVGYYTNSIVE